MLDKLATALVFSVALLGCSDGSTSSATSSPPASSAQRYADEVCACKDSKCIGDVAQKYKDAAKDLSQAQSKKISDCTGDMVKKEIGGGR